MVARCFLLKKHFEKKFFDILAKKYGLVQVDFNEINDRVKNPVYAVTKLPEVKKSILPWKKGQQTIQAEQLPLPTKSYCTRRPDFDECMDYYATKDGEKYEKYIKTSRYVAPEFVYEKEHLRNLFDVVNTRLLKEGHPEYIIPQTEHQQNLNGVDCTLKQYLKANSDAYQQFENALQKDNVQKTTIAKAAKKKTFICTLVFKEKDLVANNVEPKPDKPEIKL